MAVEIFLELPDVEGESLKSGFEGKVDILQYSWASSQSATRHSGTGGGSGQANVGDIHFSKYLDKSTPVLFKTLLMGKHYDTGTLTVRKVTGGKPLDYLVIKLEEVIISSYQTGGGAGGDDRIIENMSLNFRKFEMIYTVQEGKGAGSAQVPVSYDIAVGPEA
jgi:type VI secretion system secreted protein Hcp